MGTARKALFVTSGLICFAAGTVGIFLPILPTVPLYLLAGICLANGSDISKSMSDAVTEYPCTEDGMGRYLEQYVLKK